MEDFLDEICLNCGHSYGSHHAGISRWPMNYCPDPDETMDWAKGPGTIFKASGEYKEDWE